MQCCGAWEVEGVGWLPTLLWVAMGWVGKWWWGVGLVVCYIVRGAWVCLGSGGRGGCIVLWVNLCVGEGKWW